MIGEICQNFTEASASVGLILATALVSLWKCIKKSKYHLDIVIFLHSEHLLITLFLQLELQLSPQEPCPALAMKSRVSSLLT